MTSTDSAQEPQSPQNALEIWNHQVQALTNPDEAAVAIGGIHDGLMALYNDAVAKGDTEQANRAANAYNMAVAIFESHQQRDVVIAGGAAAIEEAEAQRQQAVDELQELVSAINKGDEHHPKLEGYAAEIRMDQEQETLNDPWIMQDVYEQAAESADESLGEAIMTQWDLSDFQTYKLVGLLNGNLTATPEQNDLIKKLIDTLPTEIAPDPLAEVFRDAGAFNADIDEVDDDDDE